MKKQLPKYKEALEQAVNDPSISVEEINDILRDLVSVIEPYKTTIDSSADPQMKALNDVLQFLDYGITQTDDRYEKLPIGLAALESILAAVDILQPTVNLAWYSDAHLAFQELVKTAKNDAIIYLYYTDDPIHISAPFKLERVTKKDYLTRDVFGPVTGRLLTETGIHVEEDEDHEHEHDEHDWDEDVVVAVPEELYHRIRLEW